MWIVFRSGALVLCMTLGGAVMAQDTPVEGVIQDQLDAFLRDDFATAFTFASPMIQGMFGSASNFEAMVKQGYPMVWRHGSVRYGESTTRGSTVLQTVILTDADGAVHALEYEMIPVGDDWQINGVRFVRAPEVGV